MGKHKERNMVGRPLQATPTKTWRRYFRSFDRTSTRHNKPYSPLLTVIPLYFGGIIGSLALASLL